MIKPQLTIVLIISSIIVGVTAFLLVNNEEVKFQSLFGKRKFVHEGNIFELVGQKNKLICTFFGETVDMDVSGTMYISDTNLRGDFMMSAENESVSSSMISDDQFVYYWSSEAKGIGAKLSKRVLEDQLSTNDTSSPNDSLGLSELEQNYDYKCEDWNVDKNVFDIPEDVEFTDFTQVIEGTIP